MARHGFDDDDFDIVDADGWNQYGSYAMRRASQQPSIHMTQQMTTKVAPAYDGRTSFFALEDAIDDWCDFMELEPEKRGPALRNRLEEEAQQYRKLLDRELLRDPNDGVNYFKRFLRPHFIKGAQNVSSYRFMQFMKYNRGTMDLQKWMTRFQLSGNRLTESWMDLLPGLTITSTEAILFVAQQRQEHEARQAELAQLAAAVPGQEPHVNVPWTDDHALVALRLRRNSQPYPGDGSNIYFVIVLSFFVIFFVIFCRFFGHFSFVIFLSFCCRFLSFQFCLSFFVIFLSFFLSFLFCLLFFCHFSKNCSIFFTLFDKIAPT